MELVFAILGSSFLTAIITSVFGIIQGRRQDTVNYITAERKKWREKIRTIADNIEKSKFQGEGTQNISYYLNQLKMNINTYGKFDKTDYMHDGHIWEIIEIIQCADSEKEFETDKKLLLSYISLMLKEDWERSKNEVQGYSRFLCYMLLHIIISVIIVIYYFFILNLENIWFFLGLEFANIIFVFYIKVYLLDEILLLVNSKKSLSIKGIKKNQKKLKNKGIILAIVSIIYFLIGLCVIFEILPNNAVERMKYKVENDEKLQIYTGLDKRVIPEFEKELEKKLNMDIEIIYNEADINEVDGKYNAEIKEVLNQQIWMVSYFVLFLLGVEVFMAVYWIILSDRKQQNLQLKSSIIKIRYLINEQYNKNVLSVCNILQRLCEMDDKEIRGERGEKLLGLGYRILEDTRNYLNRRYNTEKMSVNSFEEFKYIENLEDGINNIDKCISKLKKISKKDMSLRMKTIVEVKELTEKLKDMGNIYNMEK